MRLELGALRIELEAGDDVEAFFRSLFRHFNNMELSEILGVSPKTVTRWKRDGRLPAGSGKGLAMVELLAAVGSPGEKPGHGRDALAREKPGPMASAKIVEGEKIAVGRSLGRSKPPQSTYSSSCSSSS